MSRKENPQKLTQLSSRSHPRHLLGKRTAQKDTIIDITSDSQVNSNFPNRWSQASLTFNNYFYLFLYLYITWITINNNAPHLKLPKEPKEKSRLGMSISTIFQAYRDDSICWMLCTIEPYLPCEELCCVIQSGPGCLKLTTSLVNETLKFQTLISQICQYFFMKKCEKLLQCKSFSHFFNKKYQSIWL